MPEVAKSMGATPIPPSHFINFRPDTKIGGRKGYKRGKSCRAKTLKTHLI